MNKGFRWTSVEFHYHAKNQFWPALVIIAAICVSAFALWQQNLLFFIFILIAAMLMLVWGRRRPQHMQFAIDERGLWIGKKLHRHQYFTGFALYEKTLQMHSKNRIRPTIDIIIPPEKTKEIRRRLLAFLPEVEYTESFLDALAHWLKF